MTDETYPALTCHLAQTRRDLAPEHSVSSRNQQDNHAR